jgi:hypothetical protein
MCICVYVYVCVPVCARVCMCGQVWHLTLCVQLKGFAATRVAGAHWLGDPRGPPLQRVYGVAFPEKRMLTEWEAHEAEVRHPVHVCACVSLSLSLCIRAYRQIHVCRCVCDADGLGVRRCTRRCGGGTTA